MKSLTSRDAAAGATLRNWTGGSFLGTSRKTIPATTMSTMMTNQIVIIAPNIVSLPAIFLRLRRRPERHAGLVVDKRISPGASDGTARVLPVRFRATVTGYRP